MNKGAIISGFIVSILISSIAGGLIGYYALPLLLGERTRPGKFIKSEYKEIETTAVLLDSETTEEMIPDTRLTITSSGNSYLIIKFSTPYTLHLDQTFTGASRYNISIYVDGEFGKFVRIGRYQSSAAGYFQEFTSELYIEFKTSILNAGSHNISLYWYSLGDATGANQLIFNNVIVDFPRTLYIEEISN